MTLTSLFRSRPEPRRSVIQCPFCLAASQSFSGALRCTCGKTLPPEYVRDYDLAPPLFAPMMGWRQVGKSNFLRGVTAMLLRCANLWPDYHHLAITEETVNFIRKVREEMKARVLPEPTQLQANETFVLQLFNMGRWGNRTWVTRDVPGEPFEEYQLPDEQLPFVRHAKTVLLFLDLTGDLLEAGASAKDRTPGLALGDNLKNYILALNRSGVDLRKEVGRKFIVVLTKGSQTEVPSHLTEYLRSDEFPCELLKEGNSKRLDATGMALYMERLARVSDELREWIRVQPDGQELLTTAQKSNLELRFCLISAIPSGVRFKDGKPVPIGQLEEPRRILDPFFWALELDSSPVG